MDPEDLEGRGRHLGLLPEVPGAAAPQHLELVRRRDGEEADAPDVRRNLRGEGLKPLLFLIKP